MSGEIFSEKLLFLLLFGAVRAVLLQHTVMGEPLASGLALLARWIVFWQFYDDVFEGQKASLRWKCLPALNNPCCFISRQRKAMRPAGVFLHHAHLPKNNSSGRAGECCQMLTSYDSLGPVRGTQILSVRSKGFVSSDHGDTMVAEGLGYVTPWKDEMKVSVSLCLLERCYSLD